MHSYEAYTENTSINDQNHTQTRVLTLLEYIDSRISNSVWHFLDTKIVIVVVL